MLFSNHSTMLQIAHYQPPEGSGHCVWVVSAKKQLCKYLSSKIANLFACLLNSANKEVTHLPTTLFILAFSQSRECREMPIIPLSVGSSSDILNHQLIYGNVGHSDMFPVTNNSCSGTNVARD